MPSTLRSMPAIRTKAKASSSQQVRRNFFQKLGIGSHKSSVPVAERSVRDLRNIPRYHEPLQYDEDEERLREEQRQSSPSRLSVSPTGAADDICQLPSPMKSSSSKLKKQVSFHESVAVVPVPMKDEYSNRIRTKLWSDAVEICENVERNLVEFAAENYDWRCACMEDEMYVCGVTGDLIHPIHVETRQYVFGSSPDGFRRSTLSNERQRYWNAQDVI